jgi:hypothetical protein
MSWSTYSDIPYPSVKTVPLVISDADQEDRIRVALGVPVDRGIPKVNRNTLWRYYSYLSAKLRFPFIAECPEPTAASEEREFRCVVLSLLSPESFGDESGGLSCRVRSENCRLNLPLIELVVPQNCRNFQLIEDYWYWLWNWR